MRDSEIFGSLVREPKIVNHLIGDSSLSDNTKDVKKIVDRLLENSINFFARDLLMEYKVALNSENPSLSISKSVILNNFDRCLKYLNSIDFDLYGCILRDGRDITNFPFRTRNGVSFNVFLDNEGNFTLGYEDGDGVHKAYIEKIK